MEITSSHSLTRRFAAVALRFVLPALLLGFACLHMPGFETELNVPIISHTFYAMDVLDSALFRVRSDSTLEFYRQWCTDTTSLSEHFGPIEVAATLNMPLSDFVLSPVASATVGAGLSELAGLIVPDSVYAPVPAFNRDLPLCCALPGIRHVELVDGVLRMQVLNRTTVDLDTVRLCLPGLGPLELGRVAAMSSREARTTLAGAAFDSLVAGAMHVASPGSAPVWVRARDSVFVSLTMDSFRLADGSLAPSETVHMSADGRTVSTLGMRHHVRLDTAFVSSGAVSVNLHNSLPMPLDARVRVEEIGFDSAVSLDAGDRLELALDLAGRGYANADPDSSRVTLLTLAQIRPRWASVHLRGDQGLSVTLDGQISEVGYVRGEITDTVWDDRQQPLMVIESPEEIERMRFSHVWLSSTLASTVGFTGLLDIRAVGYNAADDSVVIHDTVVVVPDKSGGRAVTMTTIDIAPLLNISPRRIVTAGRIGAVGAGSASGRDCFFGEFLLQAPLRACLLPDTFNFGPWPVPVDPARTPMLLDDVTDGEVVVRLVNHMPVAMAGELAVWSRQGETATVALGVSAPAVDRVTGRVVAASDTTICSPLPLAERAVFTDSFQAVIRLFLPATDTVTLAARDYVQVEHSYARLTFRREPE